MPFRSGASIPLLTFVDIAVEELKSEYMHGYGEVPPQAAVELNGIAEELPGLVRQLDHYLMRGTEENLQQRLERLEQTGTRCLSSGSVDGLPFACDSRRGLTLVGRRMSESFAPKRLTGLIGAQLKRSLSARWTGPSVPSDQS
jgi:hypothetical protein